MNHHKRYMIFSFGVLAIILVFPTISSAQDTKPDSTVLTYEEDVRFALVRTCFDCHSGKEARGELLLDTYDDLMAGGENGPPVVPGSPEESILYQKLFPDPPFGKMMPRKKNLTLSEYELGLIRTWIEQGAKRSHSELASPEKEESES